MDPSTEGNTALTETLNARHPPRGRRPPVKRKPSGKRPVEKRPVAKLRRDRQADAKRSAILNAALMLFSRNGLHGTSVEQIAEQADISKPNLFYYFSSKDEVYLAVLRRLLDEWLEPLQALQPDQEPIVAIGDYIRRKVLFSRENPAASRLFCLEIAQGAPMLKEELATSLKQLVDEKAGVIRAWIKAGRLAEVDPHHLIFAIWATTQHYADFAVQIEALTGRDPASEAFIKEAVNNVQRIVLDGIRVREGTTRP
jgi:TetR/AcrR family transcriptional regulator